MLAGNGGQAVGEPKLGEPGIAAGDVGQRGDAARGDLIGRGVQLVKAGRHFDAGSLKELVVVHQGDVRGLIGDAVDASVKVQTVEGAGFETAGDLVLREEGRQIHQLAAGAVVLQDLALEGEQVGGVAAGNESLHLQLIVVIVGLILDNDLVHTFILGVEVVDDTGPLGGLAVGAAPDVHQGQRDLFGGGCGLGRSGLLGGGGLLGGRGSCALSARAQGEAHNSREKKCDQFFHVFSFLFSV